MANWSGVGGLSQRNLVGTAKIKENEKGKYVIVDAQIDMREKRAKDVKETQPHLESHDYQTPDGKERTAHGKPYTMKQWEAIAAAAETRPGKDDKIEFAVKANLMPVTPKDGSKPRNLLIKTNEGLGKSDFKLGAKTLASQKSAVDKMRAQVKAERDAAKEAPAAEAEAQAQAQAGQEVPMLGDEEALPL